MLEQITDDRIIDTFFTGNETVTIELSDKTQYTYTILQAQDDKTNNVFKISAWHKAANNVDLVTIGYFNLTTKLFVPVRKYQNRSANYWPRNIRIIAYALEKPDKLNNKFKIYRGTPNDSQYLFT